MMSAYFSAFVANSFNLLIVLNLARILCCVTLEDCQCPIRESNPYAMSLSSFGPSLNHHQGANE